VVEFPTPLFSEWIEPATFPESLALHMRRHGDGCWSVWRAIIRSQKSFSLSTFSSWLAGKKTPRSVASLRVLGLVEGRYGLPNGHFRALLSHQAGRLFALLKTGFGGALLSLRPLRSSAKFTNRNPAKILRCKFMIG
jgi:hypothetical protein